MKILVVDDEPVVAALIGESVRMQGHESLTAHDGTDAIQMIGSASPDAVFLDLEMPGLSGLELLRGIRQAWPELPIVVFAAGASADDLAAVRELGVIDIVEKPIALSHLTEALAQLKRQPS